MSIRTLGYQWSLKRPASTSVGKTFYWRIEVLFQTPEHASLCTLTDQILKNSRWRLIFSGRSLALTPRYAHGLNYMNMGRPSLNHIALNCIIIYTYWNLWHTYLTIHTYKQTWFNLAALTWRYVDFCLIFILIKMKSAVLVVQLPDYLCYKVLL